MSLRVIGDVHAQVDFVINRKHIPYLEIVSGCDYSVQIGDMGDNETYLELIAKVNAEKHRFFGGNHDHYCNLPQHALGDFGLHSLGGVVFFFVRGARSNDKSKLLETGARVGKKLWFEEEEVSLCLHDSILEAYLDEKPDIVLTHTCPPSIGKFVKDFVSNQSRFPIKKSESVDDSRTGNLLERMLDNHRPNLWCFGHYHHDWHYNDGDTEFRCVGELSYFDIPT